MENATRLHLFIRGRVQGVFYRRSAQQKAQEFLLTGWARNLPDGSVEIVAEGEKENLDEFVQWCWQGPSFAKVENVETQEEEYTGEWISFGVL